MAEFYLVDGVLWLGGILPKPHCPKHRLELDAYAMDTFDLHPTYDHLRCAECPKDYVIPRDIDAEQTYISRKLQARNFRNIKVLNLDDEAIPLAEDKISTKDGKFFVKAIITESRVGQRLVVYVGEKGLKEKTQIFVEPALRRLAFDQKDMHPTDIFLKLEGTFIDGTRASFNKAPAKKKRP